MPVPSQVQELIEGSGNNFHAKVARWFVEDGWRTTVSPYYMDQSQQKARELDLVIEKAFTTTSSYGSYAGEVVVRLFVECKFLPNHGVFWFTDKNVEKVRQMVCSPGLFRTDNVYTNQHHWLAGCHRVAKLFASSSSRGQESDPFFKALNQVLNGFVSLRHQANSFQGRPGRILTVLDFPVVVCNSFANLYAADFDGRRDPEPIQDSFQLDVQYAYANQAGSPCNESFLVDFLEFDRLGEFSASLKVDADLAAFFIE